MKSMLKIIDRISVWYYYWNKRAPIALFMILSFSGCVSIKTHERAKLESFDAGAREMAERCLHDLEILDKEEAMLILRGFIELKGNYK